MSENLIKRKLIVGLGNPGGKYENTRHNLGFQVVSHLAEKWNIKFKASSFTKGFSVEYGFNDCKVCLFMPSTYMNSSGIAVKQIVDHDNFELDNILVVCDDLNIEFERLKLRPAGSDGGNNGLASIIKLLNTDQFSRLRMGIDHPGHKDYVTDYVLEEFTSEEKKQLGSFIERAGVCCEMWLQEGITKTMEQFNRR